MGELHFTGKFTRSFRRGEVIFEEGSAGRHLYVINAGGVDILRRAPGGDVLIGSLGAGEIFGEMALVDDLPRSATAVAAEDGTELVAIDHPHFIYLIGQQPAFALVVLKALSLKLRAQNAHPERATGRPAGG
jgi:CRP/FNR family transcriptional regulator